MNLFETVKTAISVGQAAKRYGLTVGKNGMCCCPFHADKTPSMKLNEAYYYCFGCKAHGDVIALTAQLLHLPPGSAAAELAQAFHVDISACQGRGKERRRQHYQPDTVALAHQLAAIREKGHRPGAGCMAQACTEGADHVSEAAPDVEGALCPSPWGGCLASAVSGGVPAGGMGGGAAGSERRSPRAGLSL